MRIYFAARFTFRARLRRYAMDVWAAGHGLTSWWIWQEELTPETAGPAMYAEIARNDLEAIRESDVVIHFSDSDGSSSPSGLPRTGPTNGGPFVEVGYALALGKPVFVVGPRNSVFHYLPEVKPVGSLEEALKCLAN